MPLLHIIFAIGEKYDYGKQRSWGAVGYGTTALLSGYMIDTFSSDKNFFRVATGVMLCFLILDLISCVKLNVSILKRRFSRLLELIPVFIFKRTRSIDSAVIQNVE